MSSSKAPGQRDLVETWEQVGDDDRPPLIVLGPLEGALDSLGIGRGPIEAWSIGEGHSNVTYLLQRGDDRCVLRRPPRGPLPPSAHDVLREGALISSLHKVGARVPEVLGLFADETLIGAPFFLMTYLSGHVLEADLPAAFNAPDAAERVTAGMIEGLAELHAIDLDAAGLGTFRRKSGYLRRQLDRFHGLLELNATRPLPELTRVGDWLEANLPETGAETVVHGDFRLGNLMYGAARPELLAILDWEMGTVGDPLADLGYCTAMWSQPGDPPNPIADLTPITRSPDFPDRDTLAARYAAVTGASLEALPWYQALACWKSAVFLEGSYKRYLAGTDTDPYFAGLEQGVPQLAAHAAAAIERRR